MTDNEFAFVVVGMVLMYLFGRWGEVDSGRMLRAIADELDDAEVRATKLSGTMRGCDVDVHVKSRGCFSYRVNFEPLDLAFKVWRKGASNSYLGPWGVVLVDIPRSAGASGGANTDRRFEVYGKDPAAVQAFLTPERLTALDELFHGHFSSIWVRNSHIFCESRRDPSQERIIESLHLMTEVATALMGTSVPGPQDGATSNLVLEAYEPPEPWVTDAGPQDHVRPGSNPDTA